MVRIKICGITNLADAINSVNAGADTLGFNFFRDSLRYIAPAEARRIIEQLPAPIKAIGVFVNETVTTIEERASEAGVHSVQLHGDETRSQCRRLRNLFVIKAFRVDNDFEVSKVRDYPANAVLLDAFCKRSYGGTGRSFDWSVAIRAQPLVSRLFLAGGLDESNVAEAIRMVKPYAVDACSGVEVSPGRKDPEKVFAFVKAAKAASQSLQEGDLTE